MSKDTKEVETKADSKTFQIRLKEARSYRVTSIKTTFYKGVPVVSTNQDVINACKNDDAFEVKEVE